MMSELNAEQQRFADAIDRERILLSDFNVGDVIKIAIPRLKSPFMSEEGQREWTKYDGEVGTIKQLTYKFDDGYELNWPVVELETGEQRLFNPHHIVKLQQM